MTRASPTWGRVPTRLTVALALILVATPAAAQITSEPVSPYPDPAKLAHGLFGEAEIGTQVFLADAGRPLGFGAAVGARVGYDVFRWLALQVHAWGSTHATRFPDAPQSDQLFQILHGTAELKLTLRLGQIAFFGVGGAGLARLSTNLLGTTGFTDPDVRQSLVFLGGAGLDYHTRSRHFSFGAGGNYLRYAAIYAPGAVAVTAYARYTF